MGRRVPRRSCLSYGVCVIACLSPRWGSLLACFPTHGFTPHRLRSGQAVGCILSPLRGWGRVYRGGFWENLVKWLEAAFLDQVVDSMGEIIAAKMSQSLYAG
jgi:hypothetical protein